MTPEQLSELRERIAAALAELDAMADVVRVLLEGCLELLDDDEDES